MLILSDRYDFLSPELINSKISEYIEYEEKNNLVIINKLNTNLFLQFEYDASQELVLYDDTQIILSKFSKFFYQNKDVRAGDACLLDLILQNRECPNRIELNRQIIKLNLLLAYMFISKEENNINQMINYTKKFLILLKKNSKLIYDLGW
jgi:hypothetical protein